MGMDIEKLATSAIEDAIAKTDYITPYVNSGDKEPCWDGYFYAYTDTSKKNEFFWKSAGSGKRAEVYQICKNRA